MAQPLDYNFGSGSMNITEDWCRRGESNPRPRDYETLALPLSYAGMKQSTYATDSPAKVSRYRPRPTDSRL